MTEAGLDARHAAGQHGTKAVDVEGGAKHLSVVWESVGTAGGELDRAHMLSETHGFVFTVGSVGCVDGSRIPTRPLQHTFIQHRHRCIHTYDEYNKRMLFATARTSSILSLTVIVTSSRHRLAQAARSRARDACLCAWRGRGCWCVCGQREGQGGFLACAVERRQVARRRAEALCQHKHHASNTPE